MRKWYMDKQYKNHIKILFVCHGNICRSPLAEYILRDMVTKRGDSAGFYIASAATSTEEIGNPVHPPARRKLQEHGISCDGKRAVQLKRVITLNMIICWEWKNAILSI